jgi:hypothetical protein
MTKWQKAVTGVILIFAIIGFIFTKRKVGQV